MSPKDIEYFRTCAARERARAASAVDAAERAAYLDLAAKFDAIAESAASAFGGRRFGKGPGGQVQASRDAIDRSFALLTVTERNRDAR